VCPILCADITPASEVIGRNVIGRPVTRFNRRQNVDRGGDLCARCQKVPEWLASLPTSSLPGHDEKAVIRMDSTVLRIVWRFAGYCDIVHMAFAQP